MRTLRPAEIAGLLASDIVAHLATIDAAGYPHVTPIWFLWDQHAFRLTSWAGRPHLRRIRANPRVGLVIDREIGRRADGQRPNRQVRIIGDAELTIDPDGVWTQRIWEKYGGSALDQQDRARVLITITPDQFVAIASV
ncbi:pyridoxamine 5'-phosphate oxidase family protein [Nocardia sp. NPDC004604]|uniref:pyridoxamine 5'-phosphate oxidase family protein n=1 Tax=Nocardia sp. NPDC004604 TaxID=3157013 RepID=UPI0033B97B19